MYITPRRIPMPTLQVRDLPQELYNQLSFLAERDHRSLAQETIVLLKESIENRLDNRERRREILESFDGLGVDAKNLPSPEEMVREDRDNR
jgi:plasmid stability protein